MVGKGKDVNNIIGEKEDIRTLVEWQQQRYHQLKNSSLALLSGFLTLLAIIATIISPIDPDLILSFPTSKAIRQSASGFIFGFATVSAVIILNYLIAMFTFLLSSIFAVFGMYKLYNIVSNPPLEPNLSEENLFTSKTKRVETGGLSNYIPIEEKLRSSFYENQHLISSTRRDFKMALLRLPAALGVGHYATQIYFHTVSLNLADLLYYDTILLLPASISTLFLSKILSAEESQDSKPDSMVQEIIKDESGRFPNDFINAERWTAGINNLLTFLLLLTIILEMGWKYVI
ncbi:hypothetical protein [Halorussus lipolyticus]|uniref:hypothetical protein n=1 Tax=Halorussus lipolyticus TaxID=3034024 RepID=UPI0023E8767A|nr:hypothetical protein [Halorussus sp. DT80]